MYVLRWLGIGIWLLFNFGGISPVEAAAVDADRQILTLALSTEPPTLDSRIATDEISGFVLAHIMEGLTRYGAEGELLPGVAERWELRADGATFWLRTDARWSDGSPVTAADFVYAWQQAVAPATASQYAFILYPIVNAEAINRGELPPDQLGVRAMGKHRLEVEFVRPCPYFLSLTAFVTYLPLKQEFVEAQGSRYAADARNLLFNGPFVLDRWVHGAELRLLRNPCYWDRNAVVLTRIDIPYVTSDAQALYNLFKDHRIALAALSRDTLPDALKEGYPVRRFDDGSLWFLQFNFRPDRLTANRSLRRAIQAVFDPAVMANQVVAMPGNRAAVSLLPSWLKGVQGPLHEEYPPPMPARGVALARRYLEQARSELNLQTWPALVLLAGDTPAAVIEAEYIQHVLQQGLGLEVRIDRQIFKQRIARMVRGEFDLVATGWGPDFDDPLTFADLFASWNENNRGRYRNADYDHWIRIAMNSVEPAERMHALGKIQEIVVEDAVVIPTYERGLVYVQHPWLKGVVRSRFGGDPLFRNAWIENSQAEDNSSVARLSGTARSSCKAKGE